MRLVALLILFACGLSILVAPERLVANGLAAAAAVADESAGQVRYESLQAQADLALDMLRQAHERRLAAARFAAN
jgi:hypothetical protein